MLRLRALRRAAARSGELLRRERDRGDAGFAYFGEVHGEPTPAAADVEHAVAALDQELGRQVPLLGDLGVVEGLVGRLEISAAILAVGVEEQRIELAVEIVVVARRCGASASAD